MPSRKRLITAEDLFAFQLISEPRLSPDGAHVVYTQSRLDQKSLKKFTSLWTVPLAGGAPRQFTYGDQNDSHARWSPDGATIAFLSNRGDKEKPPQIYLIPFGGGEARPLTHLDAEILDFSWSPDGKKLLCLLRKFDPEVLARQQDEAKKKLGVVVRHYTRLFYKLDGYGYLPHERAHLWLVDVRTGKGKQLTDHPVWDERDPAWSTDGKWIAFLSNRQPDPDQTPDYIDLFVMPAAGGEARLIPTPPGGDKVLPGFSPDGKWIAYYAQEGVGQWEKNEGLWVVPADGSAPPRNLTEKYDLHCSNWTINDLGQPEMLPPTWTLDGKRLYFPVTIHGSSVLMSIGFDGENLRTEIGESGVVGTYIFDRLQSCMAYFYADMSDPGQVYWREMLTGLDRRLTDANRDLLAGLDLGTFEEVAFKGPENNDLQGWILKPPGFDPAKKYPSIMEIHGGPLTQYGKFFMHEFYYLASKGFVVYFTNPRGGRGYGEVHSSAIHGGWGDADYADLMAWADYMQGQPYIDPARMGVTGGSYGGYMTVWIIGHTQRFKAAVTQRTVSNFISMWGSSDFNWTFQEALDNKPPFEDLQKFWNHSPMKYIGNARTPTLVIHNEMDHRCPIEQGEQVFVALKRLGVETEFVRFPDEFHGLSRTGRADRRIARLNHILRWFEQHLSE